MNNNLSSEQCEACKIGAPSVAPEQLESMLAQLDDWSVINIDAVDRLHKEFSFKNFRLALAFTNTVGALAEEQGHHPDILTSWGKVTVTWWTHSINGLHNNDFICAAKTDLLFE
ncbi:MAG: 4a-hydroxytetrahydrobiopterin dehydratase [Oceanospirillaceae bacterium]|nr:4a-hydroxytetrahydrobiopterin dehydratase [Oceanospirillaceae bacterium]